MNTELSPVSEAIVSLHSRFIVERVWCQDPERLLRRFIEAVGCARATLPTNEHAYFDVRIGAIRDELFCDCPDARATYARIEATVHRAA